MRHIKFSPLLPPRLDIIKKNWVTNVITRKASSSLNLWNGYIDNDLRHKIEEHWKDKILKKSPEDDKKEKYYVLSMFPYPSGSLHMGHVRVYAVSDAIARFHRMNGLNVIHPMGWDAFGLPAENAAIERNIDPADWTKQNISNMKDQLNRMGCLFDWEREFATCNPNYYKWTQTLFLKLYEKGLIYQKEAYVNWDPIDQTVLAEEQVDSKGLSWRSGAKVEKKLLKQWFVKTTSYAKSLDEGLDDPILKDWKDIIKIQRTWIGACKGTTIDFELICDLDEKPKTITLWTGTPEFIKHIKFIAVSCDNFLTKAEPDGCKNVSTKLLNAKVINPFTGEEIPIYFTNEIDFPQLRDSYVGIPGVSDVDADFCDKIGVKYEKIDNLTVGEIEKQRQEVLKEAIRKNIGGHLVSGTLLRDWLISRQRYWGTPIPIIHCKNCGTVPVPKDQLPIVLPDKSSSNSDSKIPNLRQAVDWLKTKCPECNSDAVREADTMDTFVDSSWYFMRYIDAKNNDEMFSKEKAFKCLPVDIYVGGKEHATLHLYYSRFISHYLHSEGLVPTREPFRQLLVLGMVKGMSYRNEKGKYLKPNEVEAKGNGFIEKETGKPVVTIWEKMSKSKYNGVDPSEMFDEYGADTTRLIMLANIAPTSPRNWSDETFNTVLNWQKRLWPKIGELIEVRKNLTIKERNEIAGKIDVEEFKKENEELFENRNYFVKDVTLQLTISHQFNAAISAMQAFTSAIKNKDKYLLTHSRDYERALAAQIIMLAPVAPKFASELWAGLCSASYHLAGDDPTLQYDKDVLEQSWPVVDMEYKLPVEILINGKKVGDLKIPRRDLEKMAVEEIVKMATENSKYQRKIQGRVVNGYQYVTEPSYNKQIFFQAHRIDKVKKQSSALE